MWCVAHGDLKKKKSCFIPDKKAENEYGAQKLGTAFYNGHHPFWIVWLGAFKRWFINGPVPFKNLQRSFPFTWIWASEREGINCFQHSSSD